MVLTLMFPVLDPIPTTGLKPEDVDELTRTTRDLFQKEYVALTERALGRPVAVPAASASGEKDGVVRASGADATLSSRK